jgi:signal peptidase I
VTGRGTATPGGWARLASQRVEVLERSMEPALLPGDRLLVDRRAYRRRAPRPGEIVVLRDPEGGTGYWIKRVGVPPAPLGEGLLWVVGDRAELSRDSRQIGPVRLEALVGRAWYRYAPAARAGALVGDPPAPPEPSP